MSEIEKKILTENLRMVDLPYEQVEELYNGVFKKFSPDYFTKENQTFFILPKNITEEELADLKIPTKGIITSDGTIYSVDKLHIEVGMWLRANNVDLTNSIRYAIYPKGYEIYPSYESFGKVENVDSLDKLEQEYLDKYENDLSTDRIIELSKKQVVSIVNVAKKYNESALSSVLRTNCFGLHKQPYEYENTVDAFKVRYNRLYFEECGFTARELTSIKKGWH